MANGTKVYNIKINGLSESVSAVDALLTKLNTLESRLSALSSKGLKVGSSGGGTKDLDAQESLLNKIVAAEQRVEEARDKNYQYLVKIKDELKEVTTEQKAAAAAAKLGEKNYALDTMQGMKERLKDIKAVMQTTPVGSDLFIQLTKEADELNTKLKDIEKTYGQFGRNVGNYTSAFDGLSGITVQIGDAEVTFKNTTQALREMGKELKNLNAEGKQNTEEFKNLQEAYDELDRKAKGMSSTMDSLLNTFQSIGAIASIGGGLSTFFGDKNNDIQKSIQRLVALQNVLQGIDALRKQMQTNKGLGSVIAAGNNAVDRFVASVTKAKIETEGLTMASRGATIAVRSLSTALKAIGVGLAIAAITALVSLITKASKAMAEGVDQATALNTQLELLNKNFATRNEQLKVQYISNAITEEEYYNEVLKNQNDYIAENIRLLKERNNNGGWAKSIGELFGGKGVNVEEGGKRTISNIEMFPMRRGIFSISTETINDIDEAKKKFAQLNDEITKGVGFWDNLFGTSKRNQVTVGNQILSDFIKRVGEVKLGSDDAKDKVEALYKEMNNDKALQSVLLNLDKYIPDEASVKAIENITDALIKSYNRLSTETSAFQQLQIDAMKDGYGKQLEELEKARKEERAQWEGNDDAINAIEKKYAQKRAELWKTEKKARLDSDDELQSLRIEKMREGFAKEMAQLNQEEKQRIRQAEESERDVQEKITAIQELYQEKRLQLNKEYKEKILESDKAFNKEIVNMYEEYKDLMFDTIQMRNENILSSNLAKDEYNETRRQIENVFSYISDGLNNNKLSKSTIDAFDLIGIKKEDYEKIPELYDNLFKLTDDYYNDVFDLQKANYNAQSSNERTKLESELSKRKEEYNEEYESFKKRLSKQKEYEIDSLVNDEDYEQKKLDILEKYNDLEDRAEVQHKQRMAELESNYQEQMKNAAIEGNQNIQEANANRFQQEIMQYERFYAQLSNLQAQQPQKDKSGWGIVDIEATKRNYKLALDGYKTLAKWIKDEKKKLQTALDNDEIHFDDFEQANRELDAFKTNVANAADDVKKSSGDAIGELIASINTYVQALGHGLQNILSSLWSAEDAAFDHEQEVLEKNVDKYEEALQSQKELTEKYSDNINDIEDDLSTARGDRRQQLIDMLNQQKAAQRASLNEEKKIEKEKEKMEAKQEKLEQERRKREHERAVTDAIVSAALAVANGLATAPFVPVGIAMGSLAAALGAAQVAIIASQKYKDGGLLEGKSHSEGGIKTRIGNKPIELEGQEYVIRKATTTKNLNLLDFINRSEKKLNLSDFIDFYGGKVKGNLLKSTPKSKYASGGQLPVLRSDINLNDRFVRALERYEDKPTVVSVVEITDKMNDVKNVRAIAGLTD